MKLRLFAAVLVATLVASTGAVSAQPDPQGTVQQLNGETFLTTAGATQTEQGLRTSHHWGTRYIISPDELQNLIEDTEDRQLASANTGALIVAACGVGGALAGGIGGAAGATLCGLAVGAANNYISWYLVTLNRCAASGNGAVINIPYQGANFSCTPLGPGYFDINFAGGECEGVKYRNTVLIRNGAGTVRTAYYFFNGEVESISLSRDNIGRVRFEYTRVGEQGTFIGGTGQGFSPNAGPWTMEDFGPLQPYDQALGQVDITLGCSE